MAIHIAQAQPEDAVVVATLHCAVMSALTLVE
jgi:hypothetical protein